MLSSLAGSRRAAAFGPQSCPRVGRAAPKSGDISSDSISCRQTGLRESPGTATPVRVHDVRQRRRTESCNHPSGGTRKL